MTPLLRLLALLALGACALAVPALADEPPSAGTPGVNPGALPPIPPPPPPPPPQPTPPQTPSTNVLYKDGHGSRYLLEGPWWFQQDPNATGLARGLHKSRGLGGWSPVNVPYAWNATDLSDASQRGSIGWYRKDFKAPKAGRRARWILRFESVNYYADVFLNGKRLGRRHEGGYVPFEVDADRLRRGTNTLVVRADNRTNDFSLPPQRDQTNGKPGGGWWNYGGVLREVYLRKVERVSIDELLALPDSRGRRAPRAVNIRAKLRNVGGGRAKVAFRASVGGRSMKSRSVSIPSNGSRIVTGRVRVPRPKLWYPGRPRLTRVRASVATRGRTLGRYATNIGMRSITVSRRGQMLINGRPVQLRGASLHEEDPQLGAALTPEKRRQFMEQLRALGATITRAHYPLHPDFYEQADRLGIVVYGQIPFYQVRAEQMRTRRVRQKGLNLLEAAIKANGNHASLAVWSVANEIGSRVGKAQTAYINASYNRSKRLDPTRLVSIDFAGYPSVAPIDAYRKFDAIGVNSYFGWYPGPNGQIVDRELLGPYLDQLHDYYPTEALFVTEFGAEANRPGPIDEKGSFDYQTDLMNFHVTTYDTKPFINGAIMWILKDFRVRPEWDGGNPKPQPPVNHKGLISITGERKPAFDDISRLYNNIAPYR